jgi:hypothetical protein
VQRILQLPGQEWQVDVEFQTEAITNHLHQVLRAQPVPQQDQQKKLYISPEIWTLRTEKNALRRRLKVTKTQLRRELLQRCFNSWSRPGVEQQTINHFQYDHTVRCVHLRLVACYKRKSADMKKLLTIAKEKHLLASIADLPEDVHQRPRYSEVSVLL